MKLQFRKTMLKQLAATMLLSAITAVSASAIAKPADDSAKSTVLAAIQQLSSQESYRWTTHVETAARFFGGGVETLQGQIDKSGFTRVTSDSPNGLDFVRKLGKAAVQREDNWMTLAQAAERVGGGRGPGFGRRGFDARAVEDFQLPADVAREYLDKATDFQSEGDTITARLSAEQVSQLIAPPRRPRRGGTERGGPAGGPSPTARGPFGAPQVNNPAGSVTFHIADGVLMKFTMTLRGSLAFRGEQMRLDRTTTTTIDCVGSTSVDVPLDAREIVEALIAGRIPNVFVPEPGFKKLFNGRDLTGWAGRPEHWSVEQGAIVGKTTHETPTRGNNLLIAKDGDKNLIVDDFELRLSYRITPHDDRGFANAGIQYRSQEMDNFVVAGYQAAIDAGDRYSGILYDQSLAASGRGVMAEQGESITWTRDGKREVTGRLGTPEKIQAAIKKDDWNEYVIMARGNHLQHFINGVQTVDVLDDTAGKRHSSGILALELDAGQPISVALRDIRIKSLSAAENVAVSNVTVAKDFKLELLYMVPKDSEGSWVASCLDNKGRLIVSDQDGKLYRLTLPPVGQSARMRPQPIDLDIGGAHGLLYAFDSLYVMVNEGRLTHGLYRVRDTDGDDRFDEVRLLKAIDGSGEHGAHAIVPAPDGESLYIVCGNQTRLFQTDTSRVPLDWSEDHLLARLETGFMNGVLAPGGFIARTDPEGKNWELIATGFRNEFDAAFNRDGELFTFDADMEWDIGDPWYRPTRVNHVISGAEFGWRNGAGKWPDYYFDSFGAVVNMGPGSPTGVTFGYGAKFPVKYQEAFYIADWSFGKLYAVHLRPEGASYAGQPEEFVTGQPFPITDVIINPHDGAMVMTVGGRQTQSALYRVTYIGHESTAPSTGNDAFQAVRELRRRLERFHGRQDPQAVDAIWPNLGDQDRAIRYAARIALEWQDASQWRSRALGETHARTAIAALAALARVSSKDQFHRSPKDAVPDSDLQAQLFAALGRIDWSALPNHDRVDLVRAYSLALTRLGRPDDAKCGDLIHKFDRLFPAETPELNALLANVLVYLEAPTAATKVMVLLRTAPTQEEQIDYALALRVLKTGWTMELREEYFRWFVEKATNYRGGNTFASSLRTMKEHAIATLSDHEREALKPILEAIPTQRSPQELLDSREFVKQWSLDELVTLVQGGESDGRNFDRGRQLYSAVACASCHRFKQEGGSSGPDLTGVAGRFNVRDLLESIVDPNKVISDQYTAIRIVTKDGRVITGRIGNLGGDSVSVVENMLNPGDLTEVRRQDIESMEPSKVSVMPVGLLNSLNEDEILDLMAYLLSGGDSERTLKFPPAPR